MSTGAGKSFVGWPTNWHLKLLLLQNELLKYECQYNWQTTCHLFSCVKIKSFP